MTVPVDYTAACAGRGWSGGGGRAAGLDRLLAPRRGSSLQWRGPSPEAAKAMRTRQPARPAALPAVPRAARAGYFAHRGWLARQRLARCGGDGVRLRRRGVPRLADPAAARCSAEGDPRATRARTTPTALLVLVVTTLLTMVVHGGDRRRTARTRKAGDVVAMVKLVGTLLLIWLFANSVYALHYAHCLLRAPTRTAAAMCGGIDFPGTQRRPTTRDFAYFAFTLGMTFQTSDVDDHRAGAIRQVALLHSFAAFVFNIGVIAFTINALGGSVLTRTCCSAARAGLGRAAMRHRQDSHGRQSARKPQRHHRGADRRRAGEVRVRQGQRRAVRRPHPAHPDALSGELRLRAAHPVARWRPARRAGDRALARSSRAAWCAPGRSACSTSKTSTAATRS